MCEFGICCRVLVIFGRVGVFVFVLKFLICLIILLGRLGVCGSFVLEIIIWLKWFGWFVIICKLINLF